MPAPAPASSAGRSRTGCAGSALRDRHCHGTPTQSRLSPRGRHPAATDERCSRAKCSPSAWPARSDKPASRNRLRRDLQQELAQLASRPDPPSQSAPGICRDRTPRASPAAQPSAARIPIRAPRSRCRRAPGRHGPQSDFAGQSAPGPSPGSVHARWAWPSPRRALRSSSGKASSATRRLLPLRRTVSRPWPLCSDP